MKWLHRRKGEGEGGGQTTNVQTRKSANYHKLYVKHHICKHLTPPTSTRYMQKCVRKKINRIFQSFCPILTNSLVLTRSRTNNHYNQFLNNRVHSGEKRIVLFFSSCINAISIKQFFRPIFWLMVQNYALKYVDRNNCDHFCLFVRCCCSCCCGCCVERLTLHSVIIFVMWSSNLMKKKKLCIFENNNCRFGHCALIDHSDYNIYNYFNVLNLNILCLNVENSQLKGRYTHSLYQFR